MVASEGCGRPASAAAAVWWLTSAFHPARFAPAASQRWACMRVATGVVSSSEPLLACWCRSVGKRTSASSAAAR